MPATIRTLDGLAVRVIIVEEADSDRHRLERLLRLEPDVEIVACCHDGREAVRMIQAQAPDAVFLGIHLRGLDGISLAAGLPRAARPPVVFVSAEERRAFDAFQVGAVDFLPRSYSHPRLQEALDRMRAYVRCRQQRDLAERMRALLDEYAEAAGGGAARRLLKPGDRTHVAAPGDVLWIRAEGNYARLHRASGDSVLVRGTLETAVRELKGPFVRIHRSVAVRLTAIREVRRQTGGGCAVVLVEGSTLRVGRSYRAELEKRLDGA